jgi:hypothetical protein
MKSSVTLKSGGYMMNKVPLALTSTEPTLDLQGLVRELDSLDKAFTEDIKVFAARRTYSVSSSGRRIHFRLGVVVAEVSRRYS